MAIMKVKLDTPIQRGQWLCEASIFPNRICGTPRKVMRASGQRIYLEGSNGKDLGNFIMFKTALFVCDTKAEALAVFDISAAQDAAIHASTQAIKAAHSAKIDALIGAAAP